MRITSERSQDGRQYNKPTTSEVARLIIVDLTDAKFQQDVIMEHCKNGVQWITDLHPSLMSMNYSFIHPYWENGYRLGILFVSVGKNIHSDKHDNETILWIAHTTTPQ